MLYMMYVHIRAPIVSDVVENGPRYLQCPYPSNLSPKCVIEVGLHALDGLCSSSQPPGDAWKLDQQLLLHYCFCCLASRLSLQL